MIPEKKLAEFREAFVSSARPVVFFDDDPDGLCSFLQFYRLNPDAKGVIYKASGPLDEAFLKKIEEIEPDRVFILDVANVAQEFLDKAPDAYWLDHHAPLDRKKVKYFNPMLAGKDNRPVSYWSYKITKSCTWLAMAGCIGDWFIPEDIREDFSKEYPDLLLPEIKNPDDALFKSPIGKIARVLSFVLKGTTKDAMTCVKVLTRINDPNEILFQTSSKGKFIWKKYEKIEKIYREIKDSMKTGDDKLLIYLYPESKMALTSELSNEVLFENPDKFIIIGRERSGEIKCSLRSSRYDVLPMLENALKDVSGHGGGHLHACGANIKKEDFERFVDNIKKQL